MMDIDMKVEPMESMENGHDKLLPKLPPVSPPVVTSLSLCDDDMFASLDVLANDLNWMISDFDQFLFDAGDVACTNIGSILSIAEEQFGEVISLIQLSTNDMRVVGENLLI